MGAAPSHTSDPEPLLTPCPHSITRTPNEKGPNAAEIKRLYINDDERYRQRVGLFIKENWNIIGQGATKR